MKISCDRQLSEIDKIVSATDIFFAENQLDHSIRYAVDLVTEELFVNLVKYNTTTVAQIIIELEPNEPGPGIRVCLTDRDVDRFDPSTHVNVDVQAPLEERAAGGLGIYLILSMVDSISYDYRDRVSRITFTKNTEPDTDV